MKLNDMYALDHDSSDYGQKKKQKKTTTATQKYKSTSTCFVFSFTTIIYDQINDMLKYSKNKKNEQHSPEGLNAILIHT